MTNVNEVRIIGIIGAEPELKYTANKTAVLNLIVATNEEYLDNEGQKVKNTQWHKVGYFGKHAEILANHKTLKLKKGDSVYVAGSLKYGSYEIDKYNSIDLGTAVKIPTAIIEASSVSLLHSSDNKNKAKDE
jgi:single stranded DNA-binding protein